MAAIEDILATFPVGLRQVAPFPVVAPPKCSEGWVRGVPRIAKDARPFGFAQGSLWAAIAAGVHFLGLEARLSRALRCQNPQRNAKEMGNWRGV